MPLAYKAEGTSKRVLPTVAKDPGKGASNPFFETRFPFILLAKILEFFFSTLEGK